MVRTPHWTPPRTTPAAFAGAPRPDTGRGGGLAGDRKVARAGADRRAVAGAPLVFRMLGALYRRMTDAALAAAASAGSRTTAEHRSPSAPA